MPVGTNIIALPQCIFVKSMNLDAELEQMDRNQRVNQVQLKEAVMVIMVIVKLRK